MANNKTSSDQKVSKINYMLVVVSVYIMEKTASRAPSMTIHWKTNMLMWSLLAR